MRWKEGTILLINRLCSAAPVASDNRLDSNWRACCWSPFDRHLHINVHTCFSTYAWSQTISYLNHQHLVSVGEGRITKSIYKKTLESLRAVDVTIVIIKRQVSQIRCVAFYLLLNDLLYVTEYCQVLYVYTEVILVDALWLRTPLHIQRVGKCNR